MSSASSPKAQVSDLLSVRTLDITADGRTGGGIQAQGKTNPDNVSLGEHIILAGLLIQVVFFGLFIVTAGIFDARMSKIPTTKSRQVPWRSHMNVLYVTNGLIMFRSVFRVIEYAMGNNGYLLRNEVFLYVFDSVPMLAVMTAYSWKYPSEISEVLRGERALMSRSTGDAEMGYEMSQGTQHGYGHSDDHQYTSRK